MSAPLRPTVPAMRSRVGLNVAGDNLVWGRSVRQEVAGRLSLTGLVVLSVTGRIATPTACELLDDYASSFHATDTRVWPLKVGRIVASFGSCAAGFCAGQLALASERIGPLIVGDSARLLRDLRQRLGAREADDEAVEREVAALLSKGERLPGFGAPFRPEDERLVALRECMHRRGRDALGYWALAERAAAAARRLRGLEPNIVLHGGAMVLEAGLAPEEAGDVILGLVASLLLGASREGARLREAPLRELPAEAVQYAGPAPRRSPRAGEDPR
ncbi:MAG: citrate/2-methylcitrate synthase [Myxococcales bacterium]